MPRKLTKLTELLHAEMKLKILPDSRNPVACTTQNVQKNLLRLFHLQTCIGLLRNSFLNSGLMVSVCTKTRFASPYAEHCVTNWHLLHACFFIFANKGTKLNCFGQMSAFLKQNLGANASFLGVVKMNVQDT